MFGSIISIADKNVTIENKLNKVESTLLGIHIIFEGVNKIVGEIIDIKKDTIEVILVGEIVNNSFSVGIIHKPESSSKVRVVNKEEVILLLGLQEYEGKNSVYIGKSITYPGFLVTASLGNLFSNHFAIIGNSGSGKSCFVARLFQNLFYRKNNVPVNARFVLFDVYGEYNSAFNLINNTRYCKYKNFTTDVTLDDDILKVPLWFLDADDIALLLNADSSSQIPLIEKALKIVYLFTESEEKVIKYKNNVIAKSILDILTSGKAPSQIRDQVIAVLTSFYTNDINLESKIVQPGYIRTIRQCLNIDQTGKINTIDLVIDYLSRYISVELDLNNDMKPRYYTLKDLYNAFEFALLSEGVLKSDKVYDVNNILKVRLDGIINSNYAVYFDVKEYISKDNYINNLFTSASGGKNQIINFNLDYVDERFAKVLTKIYSKMFFNYCLSLENRGSEPIQIIVEEAHRYVQNDNDIDVIGYNIFDRITKEGRKYGVILGLITQRPSELSKTSLSQCSNFIILRMFHPDDLNIIKDISNSISLNDIDRIKTLSNGTALCLGNAFKIPTICKIDLPSPMPSSTNANIEKIWIE